MSDKLIFTVPTEYNGVNALSFLRSFCGLSSRMITRLKREKDGILMDGKILRYDRYCVGRKNCRNQSAR